ncbi:Copper amine oxidase N-terminal domain-containing protein [Gracilibacillus ureilyticus]|uniref:Copper amine oxidase N-terminal domain-containing protein n=1 Tax=Gracilibacillus ureilyticus TaxID=531814 RepID=A0A1H9RCM9_9BACI|nr:stalk domain-containing protein [Gracilibacillus ureilyticus]SER70472.1 Copper amine oxidase N-terminal domain-containing protein [Gracilibacillus ureilyticus]
MDRGLQKGIIALIIFICILPVGNLSAAPLNFPSKVEIKKMWEDIENANISQTHETLPIISYPYQLGTVDKSLLNQALQGTNFVRRLAGLPGDVILDPGLNDLAQHGALLLAASGDFSHTPQKPEDMSKEFYHRGYQSTSTSNISYGRNNLWANIIDGYMPDTGHNMESVGHRRWILNPPLKKTGFGLADSNGTMQVFDQSRQDAVNYNYIAWPVANFPAEVFKGDHPWSVSLNPDKYSLPKEEEVQVTITRQSDNKQWILDHQYNHVSSTNKYFNVNNERYGINNAIIFRPSGISIYDGKYLIEITGIKDIQGEPVTIEYAVDFFSMDSYFDEGEQELIQIGIIMQEEYAYLYNEEEQVELYQEKPFIYHGRTMVPLRLISEYLKMDVNWDQMTEEITITEGSTTIKLQANYKKAFINDRVYHLDVAPQIINGVTFVPVRFISEGLGAKVNWDQAEKKVSISRHYTH